MDLVKVFSNSDSEWRINIQGTQDDPLFQANDVGDVLGLTNIRASLSGPDFPAEYTHVRVIDTSAGPREATFLTEEGLYSVVFRSRKPIAIVFKKWVFSVIKEIRLRGRYENDKQVLALQTENGLLQQKLAEKASFLYAFKIDRTEPDDFCRVKTGMSQDVDVRCGPYLQVSPDGLLVASIRVPTEYVRDAEFLAHKLLKHTNTCIRGESYKIDVELAKCIIRLAPDLIDILRNDKRVALNHILECCNHDLRGTGVLPDTSELSDAGGVTNAIRDGFAALEEKLVARGLPEHDGAPTEAEGEGCKPDVMTLPIKHVCPSSDPDIERAWDFNRFVEECCVLDPDGKECSVTVQGRHRVWAKMANKKLTHALLDHLKIKFKVLRNEMGGGQRHGFQGLKVLPVQRPVTLVPSLYESFLQARCRDAPHSRLHDNDARTEFFKWRKQEDAAYEDDPAEFAMLHKYLSDCYFRASAIWRPEKKISEPGWYGVCLPEDEDRFLRRVPTALCRPIVMLDAKSNEVKKTWEKVSDAAAALGISTATVSYTIRTKRLRNGTLLKYGTLPTNADN